MTRPLTNRSSQLTNPMPDASTEGLKIYCALLERRLILYTIRDIKLRSVCELATGTPYDSFDPSDMSYDEIAEHVAQDMVRGLNLSIQEARDRVAQYRQLANPSQMEKPIRG